MAEIKKYIKNFTYEDFKLIRCASILINRLEENTAKYNYMEKPINNVHDKIMREALAEKKNAVEIINYALKGKAIVAEDEIEKYNSSYISNEFENSELDVVYKVKNENMFFIIEHQSRKDESMAFRIAGYQYLIIKSVIKDEKSYKNKNYIYPQILPIVVYTGKGKWTSKMSLLGKQIKWRGIEAKELSNYMVINVNEIKDKKLLENNTTISKIMLMEKAKTEEDFLKTWKEIEQKVEKNQNYTEDQKEFIGRAVIALLPSIYKGQELEKVLEECKGKGGKINMFAVTERLEKEYIRKLKNAREEGRKEGKNEMFAVTERLEKEYIRKLKNAREEGREEGKNEMFAVTERLEKEYIRKLKNAREEGMEAGTAKIIKNMIKINIPIELISKYTGIKEEKIEKMK